MLSSGEEAPRRSLRRMLLFSSSERRRIEEPRGLGLPLQSGDGGLQRVKLPRDRVRRGRSRRRRSSGSVVVLRARKRVRRRRRSSLPLLLLLLLLRRLGARQRRVCSPGPAVLCRLGGSDLGSGPDACVDEEVLVALWAAAEAERKRWKLRLRFESVSVERASDLNRSIKGSETERESARFSFTHIKLKPSGGTPMRFDAASC